MFTLVIFLGAIILLYGMIYAENNLYPKIIGIVLLMFGLYKSTGVWVEDNKEDNEE
jgi:hypothetical protein